MKAYKGVNHDRKIHVEEEIGLSGLADAQIRYIAERADKSNANCSSGYRSVASDSGYRSVASDSGYYSVASNSGNWIVAEATGRSGIAVGWGIKNKCKGSLGCYLVLSEWGEGDGEEYHLLNAKLVKVDGESIKADTYYTLENGEIIEIQ